MTGLFPHVASNSTQPYHNHVPIACVTPTPFHVQLHILTPNTATTYLRRIQIVPPEVPTYPTHAIPILRPIKRPPPPHAHSVSIPRHGRIRLFETPRQVLAAGNSGHVLFVSSNVYESSTLPANVTVAPSFPCGLANVHP
jgi:hypothetical protein